MEGKNLTEPQNEPQSAAPNDEAVLMEAYKKVKQVNDVVTIHRLTGIPLRAVKEVLHGTRPMAMYRTEILLAVSDLVIQRQSQAKLLAAKVSKIRRLATA